MNPLVVCFYNWILNDVNFNYTLTQNSLAAYLTDNYEYLKENNWIKVMPLSTYVISVNTEEEYPEAICLITEEHYNNLLKTIT